MKLANVIVVGLVVVGTFGMLFVFQIIIATSQLSYDNFGLYVGQSCEEKRYDSIDAPECLGDAEDCVPLRNNDILVKCIGGTSPICSVPAYVEDKWSREVGLARGPIRIDCPKKMRSYFECTLYQRIEKDEYGKQKTVPFCGHVPGVPRPNPCPSGKFSSLTGEGC